MRRYRIHANHFAQFQELVLGEPVASDATKLKIELYVGETEKYDFLLYACRFEQQECALTYFENTNKVSIVVLIENLQKQNNCDIVLLRSFYPFAPEFGEYWKEFLDMIKTDPETDFYSNESETEKE